MAEPNTPNIPNVIDNGISTSDAINRKSKEIEAEEQRLANAKKEMIDQAKNKKAEKPSEVCKNMLSKYCKINVDTSKPGWEDRARSQAQNEFASARKALMGAKDPADAMAALIELLMAKAKTATVEQIIKNKNSVDDLKKNVTPRANYAKACLSAAYNGTGMGPIVSTGAIKPLKAMYWVGKKVFGFGSKKADVSDEELKELKKERERMVKSRTGDSDYPRLKNFANRLILQDLQGLGVRSEADQREMEQLKKEINNPDLINNPGLSSEEMKEFNRLREKFGFGTDDTTPYVAATEVRDSDNSLENIINPTDKPTPEPDDNPTPTPPDNDEEEELARDEEEGLDNDRSSTMPNN